jgi:DNA helicase-2/ATP-dependent DNA helicase PcrA
MTDLSRINLNPEQKKAVETIEGPLLIIAGAGSGKTGVITCRIANMLNKGIPQSQILALTFTNKAAREMEERVKTLTGRKLTNLTLSTFHAFGVRILREEINLLGWKPNFSIYDTSDKISCIRAAGNERKESYDPGELATIEQVFSAIKTNRGIWDDTNRAYKGLYDEYLDHLKLYNAVDFDDLITLPVKIFEEFPGVLEQYQDKYRYIMVDEFQDTSMNQYKFVEMIARGSRNFCCVGDDDQSIYSWRGANYGNILQFENDYPERVEIKLERNYRSTGTILKAANAVIANNTNRKEKELWTETALTEASIQIHYPEDDASEAEFIVSTIKRLKFADHMPWDAFGILVRTNSLTRVIENELLMSQVPCVISGGESFFQRKEIRDIIAYLRLMVNAEDNVSLLRIINTPRRGIGKKALEQLTETADSRGLSLWAAAGELIYHGGDEVPHALRGALSDFVELIEGGRDRFFQKKKGHLAASLREFTADLNYWDHLLQEHQANDKVAKWKFDNVMMFADFLEKWEKDPDNLEPSLIRWLNRITLTSRDEANEDDAGKVSLMTIHASKGLEFDIVFLAGVEKDIIPHDRAITESEGNIEEERRLFYVAITRARKRLYVTSCSSRRKQGELYPTEPSPFLSEIPQELVTAADIEEANGPAEAQKILSRLPWKA